MNMTHKNAESLDAARRDDTKWTVTHVVRYSVATTWSRFNNLAWTYFETGQESFSRFLALESSPVPLPEENSDPSEYFEYKDRLLKAAISTIVFSAMACEAAIYDLSAIHLSDDYAKKVLDKLDVVAKWLVAPRLICGKSLDPSGPAVNGLRTLVKARNGLVHHKSLPGIGDPADMPSVQKALTHANKQMEDIVNAARPSFQAVILLSLELNRMLGTTAGCLPPFEKGPLPDKDERVPPGIAAIIQRCREIDSRTFPAATGTAP